MPITHKENRTLRLAVEYVNLPSAYKNSYMILPGSSEMLSRPNPTKRKRPADLFANGTSRTVTYEIRECINPYVQEVVIGPGLQRTYYYPYVGFDTQGFSPDFNPLMSTILKKIKDQKVNVSVLIPELGKTTDMFMNFARTVYEGYRRLRRGQFIRGAIWDRRRTRHQQSRWLAERWLELSYGWKPLMGDIWGLYQELQKTHTGNYKKVRTRQAQGFQRVKTDPYFSNVIADYDAQLHMVARYREEVTLKSASALGITNPLATAWELIPYSFVLDWAISVGDYLNNLDALVGVQDCLVSSGYMLTQTVSGTSLRAGSPTSRGWDGRSISKRIIKQRNGVSLPYLPPLAIDGAFSKTRAANALALLRTLKFK